MIFVAALGWLIETQRGFRSSFDAQCSPATVK